VTEAPETDFGETQKTCIQVAFDLSLQGRHRVRLKNQGDGGREKPSEGAEAQPAAPRRGRLSKGPRKYPAAARGCQAAQKRGGQRQPGQARGNGAPP